MATLAIDEVRSRLSAYLQDLNKGSSAREIIQVFRRNHEASIAKASNELENIALIKLLNDIGQRQPSATAGQPDLFSGFSVPKALVIRSIGEDEKSVHTPLGKATISEVEAWIEDHEKPRISTSTQLIELKRLLEKLKPFVNDPDMTIEDAIRLFKVG